MPPGGFPTLPPAEAPPTWTPLPPVPQLPQQQTGGVREIVITLPPPEPIVITQPPIIREVQVIVPVIITATLAPSLTPTMTYTPSATATWTPSPTMTWTLIPTNTATDVPAATWTFTPTPTETATPTETPTEVIGGSDA